jgi:hypothetical protein
MQVNSDMRPKAIAEQIAEQCDCNPNLLQSLIEEALHATLARGRLIGFREAIAVLTHYERKLATRADETELK